MMTTSTPVREPARRTESRAPGPRASLRELDELRARSYIPTSPRVIAFDELPATEQQRLAGLAERSRPANASLHVVRAMHDYRPPGAKTRPATRQAPATEIATEPHVESAERADARCAVSSIDSEPPTTSAHEPIASQSAPESAAAAPLANADEEHAPRVPGESKVTISDELSGLTFAESMAAHARAYLIAVLVAAGGVRVRAAELAGVKRQRFQGLIRRHGIKIAFDTKARGWHRARRSL
jgi:transcriptional regulator with GAF, ATPase, and Fis domain